MKFPQFYAFAAISFFAMLLLGVLGNAAAQSPTPAPVVSPSFYDYDSHAPFTWTKQLIATVDGIGEYKVTYPSPVTMPYAIDNKVIAFYFVPSGPGPHPAMIVMHEWLPKNLNTEQRMCQSMAKAGVAALLVEQPYSLDRRPSTVERDPTPGMPEDPDSELLSPDVPHMVAALRQSVMDSRRGLDFLTAQPEIDPNRMGVSGISLGGILAALVAGVDRRARVLFTIVGGGDVAYTLWRSPNTAGLVDALMDKGWTYDSLNAALAPVEPTLYLKGYDPRNALLINGRYDFVVRPWQAEDLAKALGGAKIVWANTGHYGLGFSVKSIIKTGTDFLQDRFFENKEYSGPNTIPSRTVKVGFLIGGQEGFSPAIAYQMINLDRGGRFTLDGQLTTHGISGALSARINNSTALGLEVPIFHGPIRAHPFFLIHLVL